MLKESLKCAMFLKRVFSHYKQEVTLFNKRQKLSLSRSHKAVCLTGVHRKCLKESFVAYITIKEIFSNMAVPLDLTRKWEMCDFTHLKRVQLCVKPAGFLVSSEWIYLFIYIPK